MKKLHFAIFLCLLPIMVCAQNLRTIEVYYDPLSMTKIKEKYTIETTNMLKQGEYREWDEYGYLTTLANFSRGKLNGTVTTYFGASYYFAYQVKNKALLGKVASVQNYKNNLMHGISKKYFLSDNDYHVTQEQVYSNDTLKKETFYYDSGKRKNTAQINGLCDELYENGMKHVEYYQKNGKENGSCTVYYNNGQVMSKGEYINGTKVGKWISYYKDGSLLQEETFLEDYGMTKEQKTFASNGVLKYEITYSGNYAFKVLQYDSISKQPISIEEFRYKITPESIEVLKNGKTTFFNNGKILAEGQYTDGTRIGAWRISYDKKWKETTTADSIEFYREITFGNREKPVGKVVDHYKSGQKQWEGILTSLNPDKNDGECISYYENGQIQSKQYYQNDNEIGIWEEYYNNGKLKNKYSHSDGSFSEWWDTGVIAATGTFRNQKKVNDWNYYDEKGILTKFEVYNDYGSLVKSKTAQQLQTDVEDRYKDTIYSQNTNIRQKFILNRPEDYQERVGNAFISVQKQIIQNTSDPEKHELNVASYKQLIAIGKILIQLDDSSVKKLSRKLKGQSNVDEMINTINTFKN